MATVLGTAVEGATKQQIDELKKQKLVKKEIAHVDGRLQEVYLHMQTGKVYKLVV